MIKADEPEKSREGSTQSGKSRQQVAIEQAEMRKARRRDITSRMGIHLFSLMVFIVFFLVALLIATRFLHLGYALIVSAIVGFVGLSSIHIAPQWEQVAVLRLGKLHHIAGPGLYVTIPIIEYVTLRVDQRTRCTFFSGERILTADLVPVDVNAVFYWSVWDTKRACTEVNNYVRAVLNAAQSCMRDIIGSTELEELATRRTHIDNEIREQIDLLTEEWGISVKTVKIRDIAIPVDLQDVLSKAAQAQRERDARVTLAEVEKDISAMLVEAANEYDKNEHALQLRAIHAASEGIKKGSMIVVPSSLSDGFGNTEDFLKRL